MNRTVIAALLMGCALASQPARAAPGDFRLSNESSVTIKPWFRSPCWNPAMLNAGPNQWVDFGNIGAYGAAFTWWSGANFIPACLRTGGFGGSMGAHNSPAP
jgi:hypothetical protein